MVVIDAIKMDAIKTKTFKSFLKAVGADCKALVVTAENDEIVVKSAPQHPRRAGHLRQRHQRLRHPERQEAGRRQGCSCKD